MDGGAAIFSHEALAVLYWAASLSNLGPMCLYILVMAATVKGLGVPRAAEIGSRAFFLGCALTHAFMLLMVVAMPVHMMVEMMAPWAVIALLFGMLVWNLMQTIGGATFVIVVAQNRIREIGF